MPGLAQLPLVQEPDVDNYDACYLPDGNVLFTSTAPFSVSFGCPILRNASMASHTRLAKLRRGVV